MDFSGADLTGADFSGTSLGKSNFNQAQLAKADFRNAKDYFIDPNFAKVKGLKASLPYALGLLAALGVEVKD